MILNYYGYAINLTQCRKGLEVSRDGTSALAILKAARKFGLETNAYGVKVEKIAALKLPVILHWKFNHFVVLENWSSQFIQIIDPAIGRHRIDHQEFSNNFTGVVLTFEPGENFELKANRLQFNLYQYFYKYISQYSGFVFQIAIASVIIQLLGLAFPLFTKFVVDSVLPLSSYKLLNYFALGFFFVVFAQVISNYLRSVALNYMQVRVDFSMMRDLFDHLLSLPLSFFHQRSNGDLLMRIGSSSLIRDTLTNQTLSVLLDIPLIIVYFVIILFQSPFFSLIVVLLGILQISIFAFSFKRMEILLKTDIAYRSEAQSYLVEVLSRIELLKATGKERYVDEEWSALLFKQLTASYKKNYLSILIETSHVALRNYSPLILLWIGAYLVITTNASLGTVLALNAFAILLLNPLSSLISNLQKIQLIDSYFERLDDIFDTQPEQPDNLLTLPLNGDIEVKNVSFSYSSELPLILKNISFSVKKGQKIAIVGETGSGKSTLLRLLLGLYPCKEGEILYNNNISLEAIDKRQLRRQIGSVLQDPKLFSGTIRKNISFGHTNLSLHDIVEASEIAAIDKEINQMPMKYETMVSEENAGLSGGQCQRIALARAVVSKPALLFLDEATSHLDLLTESIVDKNLNNLSCSRIVVAHRLSTIINADLIIVLHEGEIVERGTHNSLLKLKGRYYNLVKGLNS